MSLQHMVLRDFVIVRELDLNLSKGFTALTGETGAGKSILIDALQLVLGARAEASVVREGATRAEICAQFDLSPDLHHWLHDEGFASAQEAPESLLLKRTIDVQGKSRAWINGSPATATQLRALGDRVLDIHGQHAWQSLTRPEAVRGLLDAYAGVVIELHLSNPAAREPFRHTSTIASVADGCIAGFKGLGYPLAIEAVARIIAARS